MLWNNLKDDGEFYSKRISIGGSGEQEEEQSFSNFDLPRQQQQPMSDREMEMLQNIEISLAKFRDNFTRSS